MVSEVLIPLSGIQVSHWSSKASQKTSRMRRVPGKAMPETWTPPGTWIRLCVYIYYIPYIYIIFIYIYMRKSIWCNDRCAICQNLLDISKFSSRLTVNKKYRISKNTTSSQRTDHGLMSLPCCGAPKMCSIVDLLPISDHILQLYYSYNKLESP